MSDHLPDAAKMIAEREFLEEWLRTAGTPIGAECCSRPERGECCGNPDPVYLSAEQVVEQMGTRHRILCAKLAATCKPDLPVAPQVDWEAVAADQAMTIALLRAEKIENGTDPEAIEAAYMLGRRDGMEAERARSSAEIERLRAALTMTPSEPTDEDISWAKQAKEAGNG